jgi:endonuclease-8
MPEGPSLIIAKEAMQSFAGKKIIKASGNAKIDMSLLTGKKITGFKTWGKQLFIFVKGATVRIHFLMFGSYSIGEKTKPAKSTRLALEFVKGSIYFYTCSVKIVDDPTKTYDWKADVMSDEWDPKAARKKLKALPDLMVCDALLNQDIFSGVGNIIKNEVLYRIHLHPETLLGNLPPKKLSALIKEARDYCFDFLVWKKAFVLKKHWLAHTKKICHRCELPIIKKYCGITKRRTFFCENCQAKY